jgi:hypothetical protein
MSHFTHLQTRFQNLSYLERALNLLNITYNKETKIENDSNLLTASLIIPQSNGSDIKFAWNGQEYELIVDISLWEQSSTINSFMDKITEKYIFEVIIAESEKIGFLVMEYNQNLDGTSTLILGRWNGQKSVN